MAVVEFDVVMGGTVETFNETAFKEALAVTLEVRPEQIEVDVSPATVRARARSRALADAGVNVLSRILQLIPEAEAQAAQGDTERNEAAQRTAATLVQLIETLTDNPTDFSNALSAAAGGETFVVQEVLQGPAVQARIMPVPSPSPPPLGTSSGLTASENVGAAIGFTFLGLAIAAGLAAGAFFYCRNSSSTRRGSLLSGQTKLPVEVQPDMVVSHAPTYNKRDGSGAWGGKNEVMRLDKQMSHVI